ncbi:MAG: hypothetical protein HY664_08505 [Chloroflexi bacterium]|nr:hypothetical protein [Chloroflexota bacterium]
MRQELRPKEQKCQRCGKNFPNFMRLQHHLAAEHVPYTLKDICTMRDVPHSNFLQRPRS